MERERQDLIIMEECLKMLRLTKGKGLLYEKTKEFVKEKLNNNDLFNECIEKLTKEN